VGVVTLLIGASGVFGELQSALDTIWEVEPKPGRGIWGVIKDRFLSFTMVLGVAFLLLVSLVLSAGLSAVGEVFSHVLPGGEIVWQVVNFAFSFGMVTVLFALIFKYVPDAKVQWRDVWLGAAVTSLLFTIVHASASTAARPRYPTKPRCRAFPRGKSHARAARRLNRLRGFDELGDGLQVAHQGLKELSS
jgi:uncharacterized BrkB/YihY/UPF0761 family membrane protein